jgi:hypothetical protein
MPCTHTAHRHDRTKVPWHGCGHHPARLQQLSNCIGFWQDTDLYTQDNLQDAVIGASDLDLVDVDAPTAPDARIASCLVRLVPTTVLGALVTFVDTRPR